MIKNTKLKGISLNPSDYSCEDGDLSSAINLVHDTDSVSSPIRTSPKLLGNLGGSYVKCIHKNNGINNYIVLIGSDYYWTDDISDITDISEDNKFDYLDGHIVSDIVTIGNIINFITDKGLVFYIWKFETNNYKCLKDGMPSFNISYKLGYYRLKYMNQGSTKYFTVGLSSQTNSEFIVEDDMKTVSDSVLGMVEKATSLAHKNSCFVQPFLVCAAIRMYDNTHCKITPPVLMMANTSPFIMPMYQSPGAEDKMRYYVFTHAHKLFFKIDSETIQKFDEYKDLISSVDIFISSPIYTYYQNKNIECFFEPFQKRLQRCYSESEFLGYDLSNQKKEKYSSSLTAYKVNGDNFTATMSDRKECYSSSQEGMDPLGWDYPYSALLKEKTNIEIVDSINSVSNLYHLRSYDLKELTGDYIEVDVDEDIIDSLNTREAIRYNYNEFNILKPKIATNYNSRISFADYVESKFSGFDIGSLLQYNNYAMYGSSGSRIEKTCYYAVYIEEESIGETIVVGDMTIGKNYSACFDNDTIKGMFYFFYPDVHAKKVEFFVHCQNTYKKWTFDLKKHDLLDGSFVAKVGDIQATATTATYFNQVKELIRTTSGIEHSVKNEVYTSEVDNPFVVKALNVEQIGSGSIIAMVPQALALSQGQFGEYPMTCFTTDGIWALSVKENGGWSAKQPFSRDVVLNGDPGNILQLDRQIMFASDRGLMLISGSDVECISDVFDGLKDSFGIYSSSTSYKTNNTFMFDSLLSLTNIPTTRDDTTKDNLFPDFKTFIGNAVFLYDYSHQRIIIGNEDYPFSYVYNIKDKLWTSICQRITSSINSYPNCYAMTKTGTGSNTTNLLVDFSASDGTASQVSLPTEGFILTRPLKLDAPDQMKTVTKVMARGNMKSNSVDMVLLGSRNMQDWVVVGNCKGNRLSLHHGTAYKYFRVAIITRLGSNESLSSLDIEYDIRLANKMR